MRKTKLLLTISAFVAACTTSEPTASHTSQPAISLADPYSGPLTLAPGFNDDIDFDGGVGMYYVKILELQADPSGSIVTGISAASAADKDVVWVCNVDTGTLPITFAHENTRSMVVDRLHFSDAHDLILWPMQCFLAEWNATMNHWIEMASARSHDVYSVSVPSRTLGSAFQVSTTHVAELRYSVQVTCTSTVLSGAQAGAVELRIGASSPPTTVAGRVGCSMTGGLALTTAPSGQLSATLPIGWYAGLYTVTTSGSPSFSLSADQLEEIR